MATIRHLNHAPVIEAILGCQADVSMLWDSDKVRAGLALNFPDFTEVQEQRQFESQVLIEPGKEPETSTTVHPVGAFILRRADHGAAVQVRRDGFAFSQLQTYPGWEQFVATALEQWAAFSRWLEVDTPFSVFIRFINRVSYPAEGFKLETYFERPPQSPPGSLWGLRSFREHHVYVPEAGRFTVESVFSSLSEGNGGQPMDFLLDLTITPAQSLAETSDTIESLLPEIRTLKNRAFFSQFTEAGLEPYY